MNKYAEEGKKSFYTNKVKYINPYKINTKEYNDFERGWTQALKRSPNYKFKGFR
jgi:hypothetical protein